LSFSFSFSGGASTGLIVALEEFARLYKLEFPDVIESDKLVVLILLFCSKPSLFGLGSGFSFVSFVLIFPGREKSLTLDGFSNLAGFSGSRLIGEWSEGGRTGDVCGLR
jgi:hypothetical protein